MKTIVVDDELMLLKSFRRLSSDIESISIVGEFQYPQEAIEYAIKNDVDLAVCDISMPEMTGIELAKALKAIRPNILIVFITAFDEYIRDANEINSDYYIVKPYKRETIIQMAERMELLSSQKKHKGIFIQTFGRFLVTKGGQPIMLNGKAKEILALIVTYRGKEISNEEIYSTIWEERPYGNVEMKVYYNAVRRLRDALNQQGVGDLLISTSRGQMANVDIFDCDYYMWLDTDADKREKFSDEFMSEYSWSEYIISEMLESEKQ